MKRFVLAAIAATLLLGAVSAAQACPLGFANCGTSVSVNYGGGYVDPLAFAQTRVAVYRPAPVVQTVIQREVQYVPAPQTVQAPAPVRAPAPAQELTDAEAAQVLADAKAAKNAVAQPAPVRQAEPMVDPLAPDYQPAVVESYYNAPAYYAPALAYGGASFYSTGFGVGGFHSTNVGVGVNACGINGCGPNVSVRTGGFRGRGPVLGPRTVVNQGPRRTVVRVRH